MNEYKPYIDTLLKLTHSSISFNRNYLDIVKSISWDKCDRKILITLIDGEAEVDFQNKSSISLENFKLIEIEPNVYYRIHSNSVDTILKITEYL